MQVGKHDFANSFRGTAVAVRGSALGHSGVMMAIEEEFTCLCDNRGTICSDDLGDPKVDSFGTLRYCPKYKHRFGQRGCFFLDSARISQNELRLLHRCNEVRICEWFRERYSRVIHEQSANGVANVGIGVNRKQYLDVWEPRAEIKDCGTYLFKRLTKILPAVSGEQDVMVETSKGLCFQLLSGKLQGINYGVACFMYLVWTGSLSQQVVSRFSGWTKMQLGQMADRDAIELFWKRILHVMSA